MPFPVHWGFNGDTVHMRNLTAPILTLLLPALLGAFLAVAAMPAIGLADDFRPLPLPQAVEIVQARYHGRLIGAKLSGPFPSERALGVALVEELRLLTPQGNVLNIRLDARTGRFLEIAGIGQIAALK